MRQDSQGRFSLVRRAKSFAHAGRGLRVFLATTHNAWIQVGCFVVMVALAIALDIPRIEWMMLIFAAGFVFVAEAFNTAIEIDIDLTSPDEHPFARDTKDVAAAAVLLAAIAAGVIGLLVFVPHLLAFAG